MTNLFDALPGGLEAEQITPLLQHEGVRIERIVSRGQVSDWYDQEEHEWVAVLQGAGTLEFADGRRQTLRAGDSLNIPAHQRHRVCWTDPRAETIWLAVFYRGP
jgi:cupin 2 domain-containing protein